MCVCGLFCRLFVVLSGKWGGGDHKVSVSSFFKFIFSVFSPGALVFLVRGAIAFLVRASLVTDVMEQLLTYTDRVILQENGAAGSICLPSQLADVCSRSRRRRT